MLVIIGDGFALTCEVCGHGHLSWNVDQPELQTDWGYLDGWCNFYFQNSSSTLSSHIDWPINNLWCDSFGPWDVKMIVLHW
jgi:hypothetical protein